MIVGVLAGAALLFYLQMLVPEQRRGVESAITLAGWRGRIGAAEMVLGEIRDLRQREEQARRRLDEQSARLLARQPPGPVIVWFPERVRLHLSQAGFPECVARPNTIEKIPARPGYERSYWAIEIPLPPEAKTLADLLEAVAGLEAAMPNVRLLDFSIRREAGEASERTAVLNVTALTHD